MDSSNSRGLKDWQIFVRTVELGSQSAAAREMGIGVSATSKALARLEEYVSATLLSRDTRRAELTEAGRIAYLRGREMIDAMQSLLDDLRNPERLIRGRIRLTASSLVCEFLANSWAMEFLERYPDVKVYLDSRERSDLTKDSPEFDNLVLKSGRIESEELVHRPLDPLQLVLCASPKYLAAHAPIEHPRELAKHCLLRLHHHAFSGPLTLCRDKETWYLDDDTPVGFSSNNMLSILNLVAQDKGVGLATSSWLKHAYIPGLRLQEVLPEWRLPEVPVYLVWRHRKDYSPLFDSFRRFIEEKWNTRDLPVPALTSQARQFPD